MLCSKKQDSIKSRHAVPLDLEKLYKEQKDYEFKVPQSGFKSKESTESTSQSQPKLPYRINFEALRDENSKYVSDKTFEPLKRNSVDL